MIQRIRAWLTAMVGSIRAKKGTRWDPGQPDLGEGPQIEGLKAGSEIAKQLITLSVGMIALTITFLKDIVNTDPTAGRGVPPMMIYAWISYTVCILASVATLMGICGAMTVLDQKAMGLNVRPGHDGSYDVYARTVRVPMLVMVLSFLLAIGLTIGAAATAQEKAAAPVAKQQSKGRST